MGKAYCVLIRAGHEEADPGIDVVAGELKGLEC
jgi:hypothetical protein